VAWCFFIRSVSKLLLPAADPLGSNRVIVADTWPSRLTASAYAASRPAESVNARLSYIAGRFGSDTGLLLPAVSAEVSADAHIVKPTVANSDGTYPGWLQQVRDAAANGVAWLDPVAPSDATAGQLVLRYELWSTARERGLANDQVLASTVWAQDVDELTTKVAWTATDPAGVDTSRFTLGGGWGQYGVLPMGPMRVWGDLTNAAFATALDATAQQVLLDRGNPNAGYVDTISMISGDRTNPTPGGAGVAWDPAAMVWAPIDVAVWNRAVGQPTEKYWVAQSAHVLTARAWDVDHRLERYSAPAVLP
jgi:hypothetical protein